MTESELLRQIAERTRGMAARWPHVIAGPGDDCAVVSVNEPGATLLTVDQLVEGRHFTPDTPVDLVARKAVARSISDIAAMGGTPRWSLATGLLPEDYPHAALLTEALHRWGEHWQTPMVGGDLASSPRGTPLVLTVTVGGQPHPARGAVMRSTARAGDLVWVTGAMGGSFSSGRHLTFEPRVTEARWLCDTLGEKLHAMIDISDGLGRDAGRVGAASGVCLALEAARIPRHADVADPIAALRDGEDYELCFTTAADAALPSAAPNGTPITLIGHIVPATGAPGTPSCVVELGGRWIDGSTLGWDHGASSIAP